MPNPPGACAVASDLLGPCSLATPGAASDNPQPNSTFRVRPLRPPRQVGELAHSGQDLGVSSCGGAVNSFASGSHASGVRVPKGAA